MHKDCGGSPASKIVPVNWRHGSATVSTLGIRPGSELFVVSNEERDSDATTTGVPGLFNRAFFVKVNRLLRF